MKRALLAFTFLVPLSAFALDWKQPILDEFDKTVPDCKIDQTTRAYENCGKVLTLGTLAARALLLDDAKGIRREFGVGYPASPGNDTDARTAEKCERRDR